MKVMYSDNKGFVTVGSNYLEITVCFARTTIVFCFDFDVHHKRNIVDIMILIGMLDPSKNKDDISNIIKKNINVFSLELLPRITRAQSMDVLSSQSNLAGYRAVVDSIFEFREKAVPMMMTAAGTVPAASFSDRCWRCRITSNCNC